MPSPALNDSLAALTEWWGDMGVDVDEALMREYAKVSVPDSGTSAPPQTTDKQVAPPRRRKRGKTLEDWVEEAKASAASCNTLQELKAAIEAYEGSPLKGGATKAAVFDGTDGAPLMVIGEGPGPQEDKVGLPFIGPAGQLLDKMLTAIDRDRTANTFITNVNYWRPPRNRNPEPEELAVCDPFTQRMVELAQPKLILAVGGVSAKHLLQTKTGIMKLRGSENVYETAGGFSVPLIPTFHPAYLLRRPQDKSRAWRDLLLVQERLQSLT